MFAIVASTTIGPADIGSVAVFARTWFSIARSFAQRQCYPSEWCRPVSRITIYKLISAARRNSEVIAFNLLKCN